MRKSTLSLLHQTSFTTTLINRYGNHQNSSLQQKVNDENVLGIISFYLTRSISEDLIQTGPETVLTEIITGAPLGFSKQVSQQTTSSAVIPLFSSLLVLCYFMEEMTTQANSTFNLHLVYSLSLLSIILQIFPYQ